MKHPFHRFCAGLLALVICALPAASLAAETVRIPASANRLAIPERPEPVPLSTYAENDGHLAYLDGDYTLYFDGMMDFAAVDWVDELEEVEVDENGVAVTNKEGHRYQQNGVIARRDGVSTSYTNSGKPLATWITNHEDYFASGQEDAWTTVYWRCTEVKTECGGVVPTWFLGNITVSYPYGEEIRSVSVDYRNNRKNSLYGYTVTFAVSDTELYSIRYDEYDRVVRGYYHNGTQTLEYTLDGGKWVWMDVNTGRVSRNRSLREPRSFPSPRVR